MFRNIKKANIFNIKFRCNTMLRKNGETTVTLYFFEIYGMFYIEFVL
jgi:hypothetical protein